MEGLNSNQVMESRNKNGSNAIPDSEPVTFWQVFVETFSDPMIRILIVIALLMISLFAVSRIFPQFGIEQNIFEPIGTLLAVMIVATITAKTGVSSDQKYRDLKNRSEKDKCKVLRDGSISVITIDDVVYGDVVLLQLGDKIPADGTLIKGTLLVDNSILNGEAEECRKTENPEGVVPDEITGDVFVDSSSLFRGAFVVDGEGYMKVQKVGIKTMMGKMAAELNEKETETPLKVKLGILAKQISVFGYISAAAIVVLYLIVGIVNAGGFVQFISSWQNVLNTLIKAVDLAILIIVCAVPEGLPLMISLVLMQNTSRMLDHNVLVRKAQGIETAGSLNILFSDKTGTITKGRLEVVDMLDGMGATIDGGDQLIECIVKNTQSLLDAEGKVVGGNITDQALMKYAVASGKTFSVEGIVKTQGFNSENKFSQSELAGGKVIYKGAPEKIISHCTKYLSADGRILDFDASVINKKIDEYAEKAMRLLAFAYKENTSIKENEIQDELVLAGVAAIRDDVRPEAKEAIREVQEAGVQVVMITGDRLETARAIAKDAGLISSPDDLVLSSMEINSMSDDEIKKIIRKIRVIARALPTDKSRMVRLCQEMNLVCGMTGDGVNDSPALKKADVGFAMGSGTEAAKEAGDIVVLDDNFKSIKDAVWYGRTIYRNILKFVRFQISINVAAVALTLFSPLLENQIPSLKEIAPLTVVMLLFVNLVCDSLGSLMFGGEPALEKYMKEKPRTRDEKIINGNMLINIIIPALWMAIVGFVLLKITDVNVMPALVSMEYVEWLNSYLNLTERGLNAGFMIPQSIVFVYFIWASLINGFNCRSGSLDIFKGLKANPNFFKVFAMIVLIQAVVVTIGLIPGLGAVGLLFNCVPLNAVQWLTAIVLAVTVLPVGLLNKILFRK